MNSMQLKAKIKNISKEKNIDFNTLLRLYMYDRFLERLSKSKYIDNFILKGGFYLSVLFGVENRATMDIDTAFRNADFNEETLVQMIKEILSIKVNDNAKLNYVSIVPIRDEDEYGGFRVTILVEYENIKQSFHIDIVTGDTITPKEIRYKYLPLLGDDYINLYAYNIETILAEKIETILSRLELNGRTRDFYDIFLIYSKEWNNVNIENFRKAVNKTFDKREYSGDLCDSLSIIKNSIVLRERWKKYQNNFSYARNIEYDEIMKCLDEMLKYIKKYEG